MLSCGRRQGLGLWSQTLVSLSRKREAWSTSRRCVSKYLTPPATTNHNVITVLSPVLTLLLPPITSTLVFAARRDVNSRKFSIRLGINNAGEAKTTPVRHLDFHAE